MTALGIGLVVVGVVLVAALIFFWLLAKAVDQLAAWEFEEDARDDLTDADRIWREGTALRAINSGASHSPRTGPAASTPHTARGGNVLNSNFHAAIPSQKGQPDNA